MTVFVYISVTVVSNVLMYLSTHISLSIDFKYDVVINEQFIDEFEYNSISQWCVIEMIRTEKSKNGTEEGK